MNKQQHQTKKKYRVRNWMAYNQALKQRGSLTVWLSVDITNTWYAKQTNKQGAPYHYSDQAIEVALVIRKLFRLPLRQTEGLLESLFAREGTLLDVPDYTTLSRRSGHLFVKLPKQSKDDVQIVIDSSGVKVYGAGEWNRKRHKNARLGRKWKKIHVAIDGDGEIRATEVTDESGGDSSQVKSLLNQETASVKKIFMDGAYDTRTVYGVCQDRQIPHIIIPPRKDAVLWYKKRIHPRDENLRVIHRNGRKQWKVQSDYHKRSLVENTMFRFKTIFGDKVQSREHSRQVTELTLALAMLNRMFQLGMPDSYLVTV